MQCAIQQVCDAGELAAGHRDIQTAGKTRGSVLAAWNGGARQLDQLDGIAAIQRKLDDALVLDNGSHAGGLRLDQARVRFDLNRLVDGSRLQRNVNGRY